MEFQEDRRTMLWAHSEDETEMAGLNTRVAELTAEGWAVAATREEPAPDGYDPDTRLPRTAHIVILTWETP